MPGPTSSLAGKPEVAGSCDARRTIALSRRVRERTWWTLCAFSLVPVVVPVVWILERVVSRAVSLWRLDVLWEPAGGQGLGLSNAIVGTCVLVMGVALIAGTVGIGTGVYLAEVSRPGLLRTVLRSTSEVLSGVPCVVFGYFGYLALVVGLRWGYSLLPALFALSLLVVPYIAKATELSLSEVPLAYREGAEALGMAKTHLLRRIVLKAAVPGIATEVIFALAISVGETAPLLYAAGWTGAYPSVALIHQPIGYLTHATWPFYDEPSAAAQQLAYDSALLIVLVVLCLILTARLVSRLSARIAPE